MIRHDMPQGSVEWLKARLGIPTASEFHRIVTPKGKLSSQASGYRNRLIAEWLTGAPLESIETEWMQRGHVLESQAVEAYEFASGNQTEVVGFITDDNGTMGASPDRLVGADGLLEIKCASPAVHIGYMIDSPVDEKYYPQLQGQLLLTGRAWVDICAYCPGLPTIVHRVMPDEKYLDALEDALDEFVDNLNAAKAKLQTQYGVQPREIAAPKPEGEDWLGVSDEDVTRILEAMQ